MIRTAARGRRSVWWTWPLENVKILILKIQYHKFLTISCNFFPTLSTLRSRSQQADKRNSPRKQRMPSCDPPDEALAFLPDKLLPKTASMSARTPSPDASRLRASVEESACADPAFLNVTRCGTWSLPGTALNEWSKILFSDLVTFDKAGSAPGIWNWTKELNGKVTIPFFQKELNWTRRNSGLHVQFLYIYI